MQSCLVACISLEDRRCRGPWVQPVLPVHGTGACSDSTGRSLLQRLLRRSGSPGPLCVRVRQYVRHTPRASCRRLAPRDVLLCAPAGRSLSCRVALALFCLLSPVALHGARAQRPCWHPKCRRERSRRPPHAVLMRRLSATAAGVHFQFWVDGGLLVPGAQPLAGRSRQGFQAALSMARRADCFCRQLPCDARVACTVFSMHRWHAADSARARRVHRLQAKERLPQVPLAPSLYCSH